MRDFTLFDSIITAGPLKAPTNGRIKPLIELRVRNWKTTTTTRHDYHNNDNIKINNNNNNNLYVNALPTI